MTRTTPKKTPDGKKDDEPSKAKDTSFGMRLRSSSRDREGAASTPGTSREVLRKALVVEGEAFKRRLSVGEGGRSSAASSISVGSTGREDLSSGVVNLDLSDMEERPPRTPSGTTDLRFDTLEERLRRAKAGAAETRASLGWPPPGESLELSATSAGSLAGSKRRGENLETALDSSWGENTVEEAGHVLKLKKRSKGDGLPSEVELRAEMTTMPTTDLMARIRELQERVRYVADHSSNLKGTFVRDLRLCSKVSLAVVDEVHARTYAPTDVVQLRAENARLTAQLVEHDRTITKLKGIVEDLRADVLK